MNTPNIKIGTRNSALALWQANEVCSIIEDSGRQASIIEVQSAGDQDLTTPLHQFSGTGIFTKVLDDALLNGEVDIAVHSLKDYPTQAPRGISMAAVLPRGPHQDILVMRKEQTFPSDESEAVIATGSIRRRAQWLSRFPNHQFENLRGNVQTRLNKLSQSNWSGAIFALAGLQRVALLPDNYEILDWMIPAPAQGIIGITCRTEDFKALEFLKVINDEKTFLLAQLERQFLRTVEGGCSAPVGAHAEKHGHHITLKAGVFALDGSHKVIDSLSTDITNATRLGITLAEKVLANGGKEIMDSIKSTL